MKNPRILVVDDEESIRHMLSLSLSKDGFQVWCASNGQEALSILQRGEKFQFCVTDVRMPGMDGLALIEEAQILGKTAPTFIAMSAYGDKQLALEALRRGAFDYISKPFEPAELTIKLGLMMERSTIAQEQEISSPRPSSPTRPTSTIRLQDVVMNAPSMKAIARTIEKVASFPTTLLLTGETGTGKEIIANLADNLIYFIFKKRLQEWFSGILKGGLHTQLLKTLSKKNKMNTTIKKSIRHKL